MGVGVPVYEREGGLGGDGVATRSTTDDGQARKRAMEIYQKYYDTEASSVDPDDVISKSAYLSCHDLCSFCIHVCQTNGNNSKKDWIAYFGQKLNPM